MGKSEASVAGPAMVRPPRPAVRERSVNGAPDAPAAAQLDTEVVLIPASPDETQLPSDVHHDPPAPPAGAATPRRTGSLLRSHLPDAVTVPLAVLPAVPGERVERALDVPMAALDKPSAMLELTPSPVPRASLIPAPRDGALEPPHIGALNSRNVPTVAARSLAAEKPLHRKPAAAVTFPPSRAQPSDGRIARRLAADVRSSKREIVLGLTIGMALAAALGVIGQRYLARRAPAGMQAPVSAGAAHPVSEHGAPLREDRPLRPRPTIPQPPLAAADAPNDAVAAEGSTEMVEPAPRVRPKVARRKTAKRGSLPPAAAPADLFSEEPRGSSADAWAEGAKRPAKAPPSPAESAGLGMDLSL